MINEPNSDIVDKAVKTGQQIVGTIYELPASMLDKGVKTALELKDEVKRKIGLNPKKQYGVTLLPKSKRNPEEAADYLYEKFHGRPSEQTVVVEKQIHHHDHLTGLGDLVEIWIETPTGLLAQIEFPENDRPILSSSEDGTQLYIEGGQQKIDLKKLEMDGKEWRKDRMCLGKFALPEGKRKHNITYFTEKSFDRWEPIFYEHDLGEQNEGEPKSKRRESPVLIYDPRSEQLEIAGGEYTIKSPAFGTSVGIEN